MAKYNLKSLIMSTLAEQGKSRFSNFAGDMEKQLEPVVEKIVREQAARTLKRVMREALAVEAKPALEEQTLDLI